MHPKDAHRIPDTVDPDQTTPLGTVWSGSTLFAQFCLSENLGPLRYYTCSLLLVARCLLGKCKIFKKKFIYWLNSSCFWKFLLSIDFVYMSVLFVCSYVFSMHASFDDKENMQHIWFNIWALLWQNLFMPYANNKGADQPAHPRSLISPFVVRYFDSIIQDLFSTIFSKHHESQKILQDHRSTV